MTQKVNPSPFRPAEAFKTAGSIYYNSDENNFIVNGNNPTEISSQDSSIDETQFSAFSLVSSNSSFDVTIEPGEAFVFGSWFAIDTTTTVTLDNNTANQTIYAGWDKDSSNNVIIGLDSAFSTTASNNDQRIKLFDVDTDGSGVTSTTDVRKVGSSRKELAALSVAEELGIPVYSDSNNAPQTEGNIIVIDGNGSQVAGLYSHNGSSYRKTGKTTETIEDILAAMLTAGNDIDINYNDSNDTLTINNTAGYTDENAQDATASALSGGPNVSITYDDNNDTITVDTSALNSEEVEDQVNSLLNGGAGVTTNYDDANDTLTITGFDGDHSSLSNVLSDQHHTRYSDEEAQDAVGNITSGGNNVNVTYDDTNDNLTIDTSALNSEEVEDQVNSLLNGGAGISLTYDDTNNTLSISNTDTDDYTDEDAQDATASALSGGPNVSITYNDQDNIITVDTSALDSEEVEDQVNSLLNGGAGISLNYDDANNRLTITGFDGDHASLSNVLSNQHHTKTSSASELTDVSADSVTDAHHAKYTDGNAQDAVGTILNTDFNYDDTGNTISLSSNSVTIEGNSVPLGGSTSVNHNDLSTISSDDHHAKTSSASDLTDVSADSVTDAHHAKYTDENAQDAVGNITSGGNNVNVTYDDTNNNLTISTTALGGEAVDDRVDRLLAAGTGITLNYDDAANTLAIAAFDGDHASLSNVLSDQHHTRPSAGEHLTEDNSNNFDVDTSSLDSVFASDTHGNESHSNNYLTPPLAPNKLASISNDLSGEYDLSTNIRDGGTAGYVSVERTSGNGYTGVLLETGYTNSHPAPQITAGPTTRIDKGIEFITSSAYVGEDTVNGVDNGLKLYSPNPISLAGGNVTVKNDFDVNGSKNFVIEHPSDETKDLRHGTYEGPVSGGLIYRDRVTVDNETTKPDFPEYVLNGDFGDDWVTSITPVEHFGNAYLNTNTWTVHADQDGEYDIVIFGRRTDMANTSGRSVLQAKPKDMTWDEAADAHSDSSTEHEDIVETEQATLSNYTEQ